MRNGILSRVALGLAVYSLAPAGSQAAAETTTPPLVYLEQGWSPERRDDFYYTAQGSRLVPYAWIRALEEPDGEAPFFGSSHLKRLGFLPADGPSRLNPDELPIGFVKDPAPAEAGPWLGMTCAACHTGEIAFRGKRVRIDGGPSLADFDTFMIRFSKAFDATLAEPAKFARFADKADAQDRTRLRAQVDAYGARLRKLVAVNWTPEPYGHGRLDAFGHILNAVAGEGLGEPTNYRMPDAPVSYPFLWTTPQQRYVQWNGIATNPMGRNTGEVLGVFGEMTLRASNAQFTSSAIAENLHALELWVNELKPPRWPDDIFGATNSAKADRGSALFQTHCQGCHAGQPYRYTAAEENKFGRRLLAVRMIEQTIVGTDPKMLDNFYGRRARTGELAHLFRDAAEVPGGAVLGGVVAKIIQRDFSDRKVPPARQAEYAGFRFMPDGTFEPGWSGRPSYKANPLAGIWATAPYLHNGSVPTLYDLLSPENERPAVFWVGSREFDPVKVGFVAGEDALPEAERSRLFRFDTSRPGNSNRGHAFPDPARTRLDHEDRLALIEFLKTLEGPDGAR